MGDFYGDPEVKKTVDGLETQSARFLKACTDYGRTRNGVDKDVKAAKDVLASTNDIIAEKKKAWFGSSSLREIEGIKKNFEKWYNDIPAAMKALEKLPQPHRLTWAAPGAVKSGRNTHPPDVAKAMRYMLRHWDG